MVDLRKPSYWEEAKEYLSSKDAKMAKIIKNFSRDGLCSQDRPFFTLARAIVGQQISTKAADSVWGKLEYLIKKIEAKRVLNAKEQDLREVGLSRQKILYLKNIANYFIENKVSNGYFDSKPITEIHKELLAIKGVGRWTLEMFQIFYMMEPDIFPVGDIGLIKAIQNVYASSRQKLEDKDSIIKFSSRWKPWRTVATWYLWRTTDVEPVLY